MIGIEELEEMDNGTLQQQARNIHGALYKRINRLQMELNKARAQIENIQQKTYNNYSHDELLAALKDEKEAHKITQEKLNRLGHQIRSLLISV